MTSVSYNYAEEPYRVFQQMANNIGIVNTKRFGEGRRLFHTSCLDGKHSENPDANPVYACTGPTPAQYSVRQAPQVIGLGLLEAVDESTILGLADPDDINGDGARHS